MPDSSQSSQGSIHRTARRLTSAGVELRDEIVVEETARLERLIGELLDLTRLEGGGGSLQVERVAVSDLFARVLGRHEQAAAQAGVVLLALGLGLRWVRPSAPNEVVEMLHFFGIIGQALGVGFIASAGLSYLLSRRMGLIEPKSSERETPSRS